MSNETVSREVAETEFGRLLAARRIKPERLDAEERAELAAACETIVESIVEGALTLDEKAQPRFVPQHSDDTSEIVFYRPTGATLMATDEAKAGKNVHKLYSVMAQMTKQPKPRFVRMDMLDVEVCLALTMLFLARR